MPNVTWSAIQTRAVQPGSVTVPWLKVADAIRGATHLLIAATGDWTALPGLLAPCGPDRLSGLIPPADRLVLPVAPPGALIGRIGGSSAGIKAESAFIIGSSCVIAVPAGSIGPLFFSFNITSRPVEVTAFNIELSGATPSL